MGYKSFDEINEKIKSGKAVVATADEIIDIVAEKGVKQAAKEVDVVTTATFGPMCSSGAFINFGHADPPIRMAKVWLNDVPAYAGIAAVDAYIGATEVSETMASTYGGAHVIEDLIAGKDIKLYAESHGTDCYPRKDITTYINKSNINQAYMFNPRNAYQNYSAATNMSDKTIYTYMGTLLPNCGNVTYSTSGQLSPLLNDPNYRTIGIGTRVFIGGAQGYVAWEGTQHNPGQKRSENGVPMGGAGTLALIGDIKQMDTRFVRAAIFEKYGISLFVGVGIPIPILDEEMLIQTAVRDKDIFTNIYDYSVPSRSRPVLRTVSYEELRSGFVELKGRKVSTAPMSSLKKAREIAELLKQQVKNGEFLISQPVASLPMENKPNSLEVRGPENEKD
ncbi:homocysteine biosynthesis protein [Acetivibrio cellulolyticus]|uniref:homocysteine biosynthesis protein n=1 Tax=Acetivibrio cellulolyticus TaxID=35830 RepID=UPI0001E2E747|nr:homocysteine biosynthesis protein [Acetivibrio cellulolyticus]